MPSPRQLDVEITHRCNLKCAYCYYYGHVDVDYRDIPTDRWLGFWEECGEAGVMRVNLAGGEPFMRDDLGELLGGIVRNRMRFVVLSNGSLISDSAASFISGTGRCDSVQVSVDGSRPEVHDVLRGEGSFRGAVRGIRTLQRHGVPVSVRVTVHRHNVSDLTNIAVFLLEELGLPGFSTNSAGAMGSCTGREGDVLLDTPLRQEAMETLLKLDEEYGGRISASAGPLADARMWRRMEEARASGDPPFPNGGRLTACGCFRSTLAVRSDGAFVPCSMLAHEVLGYIGRDTLTDVWRGSPVLDAMRHRVKIPLEGFEECSGCPWAGYCTGNCPAIAYVMTGVMDRPGPDACLRLFLSDGGRIP
jgi:SynChlorMet cassette radical SAM/SPASM protein ScmE